MTYCTECGTDHHAGERAEKAEAAERVRITELETNRDIEIARINASAAKVISATEAEAEVAHAEGVAEGMETVLEAGTPEVTAEAPASEPAAIIIDDPDGEAEEAESIEPRSEGSPLPEPPKSRLSYWG